MLHQFPTQLTTFIGREVEISTITGLLKTSACRLLTLVGPGGIGKTRLAIQAAMHVEKQFRDGVYFIPLQGIGSSEILIYAIAEALSVGMYEQDKPRNQLLQYLQTRDLLLILDNFEQLLDGVDLIIDILEHAPGVRLLVTSREVLRLQGEQVFEVDGLAVPADTDPSALDDYDSIRLFAARAQQVRHDFALEEHNADVAHICHLVGGMPLGIELAAAWVRALSCKDIAAEIERNLDFLSTSQHDVPERHRSMRAVFEQSWRLLSTEEQTAFRRLSVPRGAFTREAAEAIADTRLHVLASLVTQSLLHVDTQGNYTVHELLRQFGEEQLRQRPDEDAETCERHSRYYLKQLHRLDRKIKGHEQIAALDEIEFAHDNIKQAWQYAVAQRRGDLILPATECLTLYYQMRCRLAEGYEAFAPAPQHFKGYDADVYAVLLLSRNWFAAVSASENAEKLLALSAELEEAVQHCRLRGFAAMTISHLRRGSTEQVYIDLVTANLTAYQERRDGWGVAWSLLRLASVARYGGNRDDERAKQLFEQSLAGFERIGDRWGATWAQALLGLIAEDEGRFADAYQLYVDRLRTCERVGDAGGIAWSLQQIAKAALELDDIAKARFYCRESLRVALDIGGENSTREAILRIVSLYSRMGEFERALELLTIVLEHLEPLRHMRPSLERQREGLKTRVSADVFARAVQKARDVSLKQEGWRLLYELTDRSDRKPMMALPHGVEPLSARELEVLRLVVDGLSNREIAARLVVTVGTVKKHLNNIFGKLGVVRRTQAIERAHELHLLS